MWISPFWIRHPWVEVFTLHPTLQASIFSPDGDPTMCLAGISTFICETVYVYTRSLFSPMEFINCIWIYEPECAVVT